MSVKIIFNFIKQKIWFIVNKKKFKHLGKGSFINTSIKISKKQISCGANVYIWKNSRIEAVTKWGNKIYFPDIIFEEGVSIQQNLHLTCAKKVFIGKNTAIVSNVTITDIIHLHTIPNLPILQQDIEVKEVYIGESSTIYSNVVILPGTIIGKNTIIGANSVVSGIFPDYCVIVGAPAKIVKRYCFEQQKWRKTDNKGNFIE
ncbi:acyltransferase [Capnocytophaga leadbetteri]|jgi:transferase hexapeptide repeat containing protein